MWFSPWSLHGLSFWSSHLQTWSIQSLYNYLYIFVVNYIGQCCLGVTLFFALSFLLFTLFSLHCHPSTLLAASVSFLFPCFPSSPLSHCSPFQQSTSSRWPYLSITSVFFSSFIYFLFIFYFIFYFFNLFLFSFSFLLHFHLTTQKITTCIPEFHATSFSL